MATSITSERLFSKAGKTVPAAEQVCPD